MQNLSEVHNRLRRAPDLLRMRCVSFDSSDSENETADAKKPANLNRVVFSSPVSPLDRPPSLQKRIHGTVEATYVVN